MERVGDQTGPEFVEVSSIDTIGRGVSIVGSKSDTPSSLTKDAVAEAQSLVRRSFTVLYDIGTRMAEHVRRSWEAKLQLQMHVCQGSTHSGL